MIIDPWEDSGWKDAADEYHKARGGRPFIVEIEPNRLKQLRRLMARRDPERRALASFRRSGCDGSYGSPAPIVAMNVSLIAASIHTCA